MTRLAPLLGRIVSAGAVIYGLLLLASGIGDGYAGWIRVLIVVAGVLAAAGGVLFLLGLDRIAGGKARTARAWGWGMFTVAFMLPTSLLFVLLAGSVLSFPAIRLRSDPAA